MDGGIGESLLLENVLTGAAVGGGLSLLTGSNPLMGALTGGIGGGIKGFLPDFTKIFSPSGTPGIDVATSAVNQAAPSAISQAGQAFMGAPSILGQAGNYGFTADAAPIGLTADAATAIPSYAQNPLNQALTYQNQITQNPSPNVPGVTNVSQQVGGANLTGTGSAPAAQPTDFEKIIKSNDLRPITPAPTGVPSGTVLPNGNVVYNGNVYRGTEITNAQNPSFLQKYKTPLLLGGLGLAYKMATEKPSTVSYTQPNYPKFGLASNYAALPNPTAVYPRFAEGGIAALAAGGNMAPDKVNVDFMHGDMFPMSQQQRSFYATPSQMPTGAQEAMASYEPKTNPLTGQVTAHMASGGISDLGAYSDGGRMLRGPGDGMSDSIPGMIADKRPARLAEGEFVVPADVVSHLGNGSTDAGAKQLYAMMDRVRKARTGTAKQGKQINPRKLMTA